MEATIYPHPSDTTIGYVESSRKIQGKVVTTRHEVALPCQHMTGPIVTPCSSHKHGFGKAHECRFLCEDYLAACELADAAKVK